MATRWLWAVLLGLMVAGCQFGDEAAADPVEQRLGQEFVLSGGQQATISGEALRLRFADVLEDSRCPTEVQCVWTGQARIAVELQTGDAAPSAVEFTLNPAPNASVQSVSSQGYTVSLRSLEPYPATTDDIPLEDYRAALSVNKS